MLEHPGPANLDASGLRIDVGFLTCRAGVLPLDEPEKLEHSRACPSFLITWAGFFVPQLGDGLFEVRARAKKVRIRLLFGFMSEKRIVIVWGGTKDQNRLPPSTIQTARRLLEEAKATIERLYVVNIH